MYHIEFTTAEREALHHERFYHPHPRIRQKMEALYLKSQELSTQDICRLCAISKATFYRYLHTYMAFVLPRDDTALDDAVLERVEANHRVHPVVAAEVGLLAGENLLKIPAGVAMQVLYMGGVQGVLLALQPATG